MEIPEEWNNSQPVWDDPLHSSQPMRSGITASENSTVTQVDAPQPGPSRSGDISPKSTVDVSERYRTHLM